MRARFTGWSAPPRCTTKTVVTSNNRTQIANRLWDKAGLYSICPRLARVIRGTARTPLIADHAKSDKNTNVIKARILPRPDKMISRDTQPRLSPIPMPKRNVPKNKWLAKGQERQLLRSGMISVPYASFNWIRFHELAFASQPWHQPTG